MFVWCRCGVKYNDVVECDIIGILKGQIPKYSENI